MIVQLFYLLVNSLQCRIRCGAFAQKNDARHHIVVIDNLPIFPMHSFGKLPQPDFGPLRHHRNILDSERGSILRQNHGLLNVVHPVHQSHRTHIDLLQTLLNKASTRIGVVVSELLLHLRQTQSVSHQLVGIHSDLIFARRPAKA